MPTFTTNDIHLHFTDEGQGEPVVLLHGFPLSAEMWAPQRAALSAHYRVIAPDLRGHGRSDAPTGPSSIAAYADDVWALLDALGIGQATVGGFSMGGYVTLALLRRHPERIKALLLIDTKMTPDTATGRQGRNEMIKKATEQGAAAIAEAMLPKMLTAATQAANPALVAHVQHLMAATPVSGIVGALEALRDRPDATETLRGCTLPTLIIVGREDALTTPSDAEAMRAIVADATLIEIADAAHLAPLEQPAAVNAALLDFLAQHG